MYWQIQSDMYFKMAGGWTGFSPFEFDRIPIVNYFFGQTDLPEAGDQLKAYLARFAVTAIVADPSYERLPHIRASSRIARRRSATVRWCLALQNSAGKIRSLCEAVRR